MRSHFNTTEFVEYKGKSNLDSKQVNIKNIMEYKGYLGSVEFSEEDEMFFGRVLGIRSLISYEGDNAKDLISDFHAAVDEYLKLCEDEGKKPEKVVM